MHNHTSYKPLFTLILLILLATFLLPFVDPTKPMQNFMGLFFVTFSYFKLINLKEFAQSFSQYDPLAKILKPYALFYPFLEVLLGLAFLTSFNLKFTSLIAAIVTGLGAFGIYKTIKNKQIIECACLGMVFKLPLSRVSLIENLVMFVMSVSIYINL